VRSLGAIVGGRREGEGSEGVGAQRSSRGGWEEGESHELARIQIE